MAWWPDKRTQINYLNYMNQQGLGAGAFENKVEQALLTGASQQVQRKIEEKIGKEGDTKWLRTLMGAFVKPSQTGISSQSLKQLVLKGPLAGWSFALY